MVFEIVGRFLKASTQIGCPGSWSVLMFATK